MVGGTLGGRLAVRMRQWIAQNEPNQNRSGHLQDHWYLEKRFNFLRSLSNLLGSYACVEHHSSIYYTQCVITKMGSEIASYRNTSTKPF